MKYTAQIDGGQGGDTSITANTAAEALVEAIDWAREGDWPEDGCDVDVSVENDEDGSDSASEIVHILSESEKQNEKLDAEGEVLGEDEGEFQTEQVVRIEDGFFYRRNNGGSRGAYNHRTNLDVFECNEIDRREARRTLLKFGLDPVEVADKTKDR
jgi:hypothetical protein